MNKSRWQYLKSLTVGPGRYAHMSAAVRMLPNPAGDHLPLVPWIERPGHTYDVGRNAAKRARRVAAKLRA